MLSNKPYLLRAFYEWIVDSGCTPLLTVNANSPRVSVPTEFVENGEIALNISPDAIRDLKITNKHVEFRASFSGIVHIITAPITAILAIYTQENGQGMFFDPEEFDENAWEEQAVAVEETGTQSGDNGSATKKSASHLRVIK